MKARWKLKTFLKNLRELGRHRLDIDANLLIDQAVWEAKTAPAPRIPRILSPLQSVEWLLKTGNSLARYGDGELNIIAGRNITFQKHHPRLGARLRQILTQPQPGLAVGLSRSFVRSPNLLQMKAAGTKDYERFVVSRLRGLLGGIVDLEAQYLDAGLSEYIGPIRLLWGDKSEWGGGTHATEDENAEDSHVGTNETPDELPDPPPHSKILLVGAAEAFAGYEFDLFAEARKKGPVEQLHIPNKNCFSHYDEILKKITAHERETLVILMAGPTACLLAADLAELGYRALDLGHVMKYYDWAKRGLSLDEDELIAKFYGVDR